MKELLRDRSGHTAIEYGMIASFCAMLIIAALTTMGGALEAKFTSLLDGFTATPW